jgi:hypothetical protein
LQGVLRRKVRSRKDNTKLCEVKEEKNEG